MLGRLLTTHRRLLPTHRRHLPTQNNISRVKLNAKKIEQDISVENIEQGISVFKKLVELTPTEEKTLATLYILFTSHRGGEGSKSKKSKSKKQVAKNNIFNILVSVFIGLVLVLNSASAIPAKAADIIIETCGKLDSAQMKGNELSVWASCSLQIQDSLEDYYFVHQHEELKVRVKEFAQNITKLNVEFAKNVTALNNKFDRDRAEGRVVLAAAEEHAGDLKKEVDGLNAEVFKLNDVISDLDQTAYDQSKTLESQAYKLKWIQWIAGGLLTVKVALIALGPMLEPLVPDIADIADGVAVAVGAPPGLARTASQVAVAGLLALTDNAGGGKRTRRNKRNRKTSKRSQRNKH